MVFKTKDSRYVTCDGDKFYFQKRDQYYIHWPTRRCLHRVIWEAANGPIPKGSIVHHIDHDKQNNALENLECMSIGEHVSHHNKAAVRKKGYKLNISKGERLRRSEHAKGIKLNQLGNNARYSETA